MTAALTNSNKNKQKRVAKEKPQTNTQYKYKYNYSCARIKTNEAKSRRRTAVEPLVPDAKQQLFLWFKHKWKAPAAATARREGHMLRSSINKSVCTKATLPIDKCVRAPIFKTGQASIATAASKSVKEIVRGQCCIV